MTKYWMGVACREHVERGVSGGFAQVCHGKSGPLKRMETGDWIVYYSPVIFFGQTTPCRSFTAVGTVKEGEPYMVEMSTEFHPWRRNVHFLSSKETPIEPLLEQLSFITDKKRWGFPFRRGCFEIPKTDFQLIANAMGASLHG